MMNLNLIEDQPRWRVAIVAAFAKIMGVLIHVEGIPFGSNRSRRGHASETMEGATGGVGETADRETVAEAITSAIRTFSSPTIGRGDVHGGQAGYIVYERDGLPFIVEAVTSALRHRPT